MGHLSVLLLAEELLRSTEPLLRANGALCIARFRLNDEMVCYIRRAGILEMLLSLASADKEDRVFV